MMVNLRDSSEAAFVSRASPADPSHLRDDKVVGFGMQLLGALYTL